MDNNELSTWLKKNELEELESILLNEGFDLATVQTLTEEELISIGIDKLGLRKRLLKAIGAAPSPSPARRPAQAAKAGPSRVPLIAGVVAVAVIAIGVGSSMLAGPSPCKTAIDGVIEIFMLDASSNLGFDSALMETPEAKELLTSATSQAAAVGMKVCEHFRETPYKAEVEVLLTCVSRAQLPKDLDRCEPSKQLQERLKSYVEQSGLKPELVAVDRQELRARLRDLEKLLAQRAFDQLPEKEKCRRRQAEAKSNLKALFQAQKSFFAEYDEYSDLNTIGFDPEPGNRYTYCNDVNDCRACEQGPSSNSGFPRAMCNGVRATQSGCLVAPAHSWANEYEDQFTACATANLDGDATLDAWRINDSNALVNDSDDCAD